ncbi:hypothetical protein ACH4GM_31910 [Streptomyces coeruleorubidus]|uniref:hypothetical protein n=1 Tax=Streptomyces coeruleorubidus TaxID=116188 RepID=UPI00378F7CFB
MGSFGAKIVMIGLVLGSGAGGVLGVTFPAARRGAALAAPVLLRTPDGAQIVFLGRAAKGTVRTTGLVDHAPMPTAAHAPPMTYNYHLWKIVLRKMSDG